MVKRYAVIRDGKCVNVILLDQDDAPFFPLPAGATLQQSDSVQIEQVVSPEVTKAAADKAAFATHAFKNMTPAEADAWIVANVTDLASAKVALRHMARAIMYLIRRSDLE